MLVDFLLALRADVKGVMRRIRSSIRRYAIHGNGGDDGLDALAFSVMSSSSAREKEEKVTETETAVFLSSACSMSIVQLADVRSLFCRGIINRGLSIQGRGQQKNRRVWVLVRRKALRLVDAELDQLLDEDEEAISVDQEEESEGGTKTDDTSSKRRVLPLPTTPMVATTRTREVPQGFQSNHSLKSLKVTPISTVRKTPPKYTEGGGLLRLRAERK